MTKALQIWNINGGVVERLITAVLKTAVPERVPGVRIPAPPQSFKLEIVAQPVRASDCDSEGRGFETHHSPKK